MAESGTDTRAALLASGSYFEVVDEDVRGVRMPVFRHRARSLRELLDRTAGFGERTYLVDGDVRLSFATHLAHVDALAAALRDRFGLRQGDRVAIYAANRWEWVVAFWAVATTGAIPAAFNSWWTPDEFAHASALVEPALVIGDAPRLARAAQAAGTLPLLDLDEVPGLARAHRGARPAPVTVDEDDPAVLIFTSGTTGRPKAVSTAHRGLCGLEQVNRFTEMLAMVALGRPVPASVDDLPVRDDVVLVTSPLFHTSMLYGVVLRAAAAGTAGVLLPGRFDPERVLATIERERVTSWLALGSAAPGSAPSRAATGSTRPACATWASAAPPSAPPSRVRSGRPSPGWPGPSASATRAPRASRSSPTSADRPSNGTPPPPAGRA